MLPVAVNITSWSGLQTFRGFQLTVFNETSHAVGHFGADVQTICNGGAATHNDSSDKLHATVTWTPPHNSGGQIYFIW